jgi:cation:H+ antiporter
LAFASEVMILSASEMADRLRVPESIIAVTIIALGTSLPELVTSLTAVRKGFGEIALGNIIGADILNVLLVAGASVAFAKDGFYVEKVFFTRSFPVMITSLCLLRLGLMLSKKYLRKWVGIVLFAFYCFFTYLNLQDILS